MSNSIADQLRSSERPPHTFRRSWGAGLALPLLATMLACSHPAGGDVAQSRYSIVMGQEATQTDLPGTVAVVTPDELCSGVLIAPTLVLTAAHCLYVYAAPGIAIRAVTSDETSVVIGAASLTDADDATTYDVVEIAKHPLYESAPDKPDYDLALLSLSRASRTSFLTWTTVSGHPPTIQAGALLRISGYGSDDPHGESGGGRLRSASVSIRTIETSSFIASSVEGADSCAGDSGGPATIDIAGTTVLVGIISSGVVDEGHDTLCGQGGLYTRVASELPTLIELIEGMNPAHPVANKPRLEDERSIQPESHPHTDSREHSSTASEAAPGRGSSCRVAGQGSPCALSAWFVGVATMALSRRWRPWPIA